MRILHIHFATYTEGWSYQENLLPRYQKKLGHDVWMLTGNKSFDTSGKVIRVEPVRYDTTDGVHVIRIETAERGKVCTAFAWYPIFDTVRQIEPDYIFFHGMTGLSILQAIRYKKSKKQSCCLALDNHCDEYNDGHARQTVKGRVVSEFLRGVTKAVIKDVDMVFGVTDGRTEYAKRNYNIPKEKCRTLLMGVDPECVRLDKRMQYRTEYVRRFNLDPKKKWIVTGGKLDKNKCTIELCQAIKNIKKNFEVEFLIFGSIGENVRAEMDVAQREGTVTYIGFLDVQQIHEVFVMCDLGVFPGGHSVLWEQAVGCGLPCIFQYRKGMTHVDIGGNCTFFQNEDVQELEGKIKNVLEDNDRFLEMKKVSLDKGMKKFSYQEIARASMEIFDDQVTGQ